MTQPYVLSYITENASTKFTLYRFVGSTILNNLECGRFWNRIVNFSPLILLSLFRVASSEYVVRWLLLSNQISLLTSASLTRFLSLDVQ